MFTLFEHAEVFAPEPLGRSSILAWQGTVVAIGDIDPRRVPAPCEVFDAGGCVVTPGFVDPHSHLVGTGGEQGYLSRTPEVPFEELVLAGVTTVVGCLGTDDIARSLTTLLAKTRQLQRQGISAWMYTGSFYVPPPTITRSVRDDLIIVPEVVGVGELAIADLRSNEPTAQELARLASEAMVGGLLGEKAGVTHFHVGPGKRRLQLLRSLLDEFELPARHLYPTHIARNRELMDEAIALSRKGSFVDIDTIDPGLGRWVRYFVEHGGARDRLTASSDAHAPKGVTGLLREQFLQAVREEGLPLEVMLPVVTKNPARALKLHRKGRLQPGADADLLVMWRKTLELRDVFAGGRFLLRDGRVQPPPEPEESED